MGVVRADDREASRSSVLDGREMIDGIDQVAGRTGSKVSRASRPLNSVVRADQQTTAFVRSLGASVSQYLLEDRLADLNL